MFLFGWILIGSRVALEFPSSYTLVHSMSLVLLVLIMVRHTKNDIWYVVFLYILPDYFRSIILITFPKENAFNFLSIISTIAVMIGVYYDKIPMKWNY